MSLALARGAGGAPDLEHSPSSSAHTHPSAFSGPLSPTRCWHRPSRSETERRAGSPRCGDHLQHDRRARRSGSRRHPRPVPEFVALALVLPFVCAQDLLRYVAFRRLHPWNSHDAGFGMDRGVGDRRWLIGAGRCTEPSCCGGPGSAGHGVGPVYFAAFSRPASGRHGVGGSAMPAYSGSRSPLKEWFTQLRPRPGCSSLRARSGAPTWGRCGPHKSSWLRRPVAGGVQHLRTPAHGSSRGRADNRATRNSRRSLSRAGCSISRSPARGCAPFDSAPLRLASSPCPTRCCLPSRSLR